MKSIKIFKMRKIFFCCLLLLYIFINPFFCIAQPFKILIGPDKVETSTKDFSRNSEALLKTILPLENKPGYISLIETWKMISPEFDKAGVLLYDENLQVILEKDLLPEIKKANVFDLVKLGGRFFFLYTTSSKDKYSVYSVEIDAATLEKKGEAVLLAAFDKLNNSDSFGFETGYSEDSTKVLLFCTHHYYFTGSKQIDFIALDKGMNKIYSNKYLFEKSSEAVKIKDYFIANDGTTYVTYLMKIKGYVNKSYIKKDDAKVAPYEFGCLKINAEGVKVMVLPSNELFIESVHAYQDNKGKVSIAGVYKEDYDDVPSGTYHVKISDNDNLKFKTYPFPVQLKSLFVKDATLECNDYRQSPGKIITDGDALYLFEQYYYVPKLVRGNYFPNIYKDILFCAILPGDTAKFSFIAMPEKKDTKAFTEKSTSLYLVKNIFNLLFYNEGGKEADGLYNIKIDKNGSLVSSDIVADKKKLDGFVIGIAGFVRYGNNFFARAVKDNHTQLCKLTITE